MVQQACDYTGVTVNPIVVTAGASVLLTVELHDFSHDYWAGFTHIQIHELTHNEIKGDK